MTEDVVRLSINLAPDVAAELQAQAERDGTSVTETVRRAIAVLRHYAKVEDAGDTIAVVSNGHTHELRLNR